MHRLKITFSFSTAKTYALTFSFNITDCHGSTLFEVGPDNTNTVEKRNDSNFLLLIKSKTQRFSLAYAEGQEYLSRDFGIYDLDSKKKIVSIANLFTSKSMKINILDPNHAAANYLLIGGILGKILFLNHYD